jgi:alkylhydroperoxidase family enzyme
MPRIPLVLPQELTPEQREAYDSSPGGKMDFFLLLAHAKTLYPGFRSLTQAIFSQLSVPPMEREIFVLATVHLDRGAYQWAQHVQIASEMGIPQAKIDAIASDRFGDAIFNDRERALLAFTRQVVRAVRVDDYVFREVASFYDARQIVESIYTIGCYMMILRVSEIAELKVDAVHGAALVRSAVAAQKDADG